MLDPALPRDYRGRQVDSAIAADGRWSEERPKRDQTWSVVLDSILVLLVVAGWGAYLVPFWVRRHDGPAAELRSIQGFSTAMRTLSRRKPAYVDGRYVVMPAGPKGTGLPQAVHVSGASAKRGEEHSVTRKRQTLLALLIATTVLLPMAVWVGGLTAPLFVLSAGATVGYAVLLRRETVRANQRRRRARQLARRRQAEAEHAAYLEEAAAAEAAARSRTPRPVRARQVPEQPVPEEREWRLVVGE